MRHTIGKVTIRGFKSIRKLEDFELTSLNVLIGANGSGKSNFVGFFRLLREIVEQRLQVTLQTVEGGADACLFMGPKLTADIAAKLHFGQSVYGFRLAPAIDNRLIFADEFSVIQRPGGPHEAHFGAGESESRLKLMFDDVDSRTGQPFGSQNSLYRAISSWTVYHFHDTSLTAGVRRQTAINDNEVLRPEAENLAAFLYRLRQTDPAHYKKIRDVVRLAAPFFDDFHLRPVPLTPDLIQLEWRQRDSDHLFRPHQLSDGTLRFICLATAILQPSPPPTSLFDEPELGLHPYALTLLGALIRQVTSLHAADVTTQVIVATQSASLLNEFDPEDVIVVERHRGESTFRRLNSADLSEWLKDYSLGELWRKKVFGGRPGNENAPHPVTNGTTHS